MIDMTRITQALNVADKKESQVLQPQIIPQSSAIMVKRYMIEISTYPNGNEYIKAWCVHTGEKKNTLKKKKEKKVMNKVKVESQEVY